MPNKTTELYCMFTPNVTVIHMFVVHVFATIVEIHFDFVNTHKILVA